MANEVMEFALTNDPGEVVAALNAAFDGTTQTGLKAESANTAANLVSTTDQDIGDVNLRAKTLQSDVAPGTPPLTVASPTEVPNLRAAKATDLIIIGRGLLNAVSESNVVNLGNVVVPSGKQLILKLYPTSSITFSNTNTSKNIKTIGFGSGIVFPSYIKMYGAFNGATPYLTAGNYNNLTITIYHATYLAVGYTDGTTETLTTNFPVYYEIVEVPA